MLTEHRVHDPNERLVTVEQSMPAGAQVAFQPSLTLVLAQHWIEHAAGGCQELIVRVAARVPLTSRNLEDGTQEIREGLVWAKDTKIARLRVRFHDIAQKEAQDVAIARFDGARSRHGYGVRAEIRHAQIPQEFAAVGVRVCAHAAVALGCELGKFVDEPAVLVE